MNDQTNNAQSLPTNGIGSGMRDQGHELRHSEVGGIDAGTPREAEYEQDTVDGSDRPVAGEPPLWLSTLFTITTSAEGKRYFRPRPDYLAELLHYAQAIISDAPKSVAVAENTVAIAEAAGSLRTELAVIGDDVSFDYFVVDRIGRTAAMAAEMVRGVTDLSNRQGTRGLSEQQQTSLLNMSAALERMMVSVATWLYVWGEVKGDGSPALRIDRAVNSFAQQRASKMTKEYLSAPTGSELQKRAAAGNNTILAALLPSMRKAA